MPWDIEDVIYETNSHKQVDTGKQVVITNPPAIHSSSDHNADIWYEKGEDAENCKNVKYSLFSCTFGWFRIIYEEQYQVGQKHKCSQVYKITYFQDDG